jgi:hypothetical protein
MQVQVVGKGPPVFRSSRGIKGKKPMPIVTKSPQKLQSPKLITISPRKTVVAKPQNSPMRPVAQNLF